MLSYLSSNIGWEILSFIKEIKYLFACGHEINTDYFATPGTSYDNLHEKIQCKEMESSCSTWTDKRSVESNLGKFGQHYVMSFVYVLTHVGRNET